MKKVNDILEASSLLGKMINMGGRRAKVTSIAKQGDGRYDTDYEIRFLDDNTKTVLSDPMVRAFMESVELEEKVVKGEVAPFVVKQRDGNYVTQTQGKKIKYVGRELDKAQ